MREQTKQIKVFNDNLGLILKAQRIAKGYSLRYVAEKMDVSWNLILYYESGTVSINAFRLKQYCKVVGVSCGDVLDKVPESEIRIFKGSDVNHLVEHGKFVPNHNLYISDNLFFHVCHIE